MPVSVKFAAEGNKRSAYGRKRGKLGHINIRLNNKACFVKLGNILADICKVIRIGNNIVACAVLFESVGNFNSRVKSRQIVRHLNGTALDGYNACCTGHAENELFAVCIHRCRKERCIGFYRIVRSGRTAYRLDRRKSDSESSAVSGEESNLAVIKRPLTELRFVSLGEICSSLRSLAHINI